MKITPMPPLTADDMRALAPEAATEAARRYPGDAERALTFFRMAVGLQQAPVRPEDIEWAERHIAELHAPRASPG